MSATMSRPVRQRDRPTMRVVGQSAAGNDRLHAAASAGGLTGVNGHQVKRRRPSKRYTASHARIDTAGSARSDDGVEHRLHVRSANWR